MTTIWTGLSVGSIYALVALGFQIPLAQSGVFNFAQGTMFVVGAFTTWALTVQHDLPLLVALPVCVAITTAVGALIELVAVRPLGRSRGHSALITTVGVSIVLEGVLLLLFGDTPLALRVFAEGTTWSWLGGRLQPVDVLLMLAALTGTVGFGLLCTRSQWGLAGRASTVDEDAAAAHGIDGARLRVTSFALAGALAGVVGPLVGTKASVSLTLAPTLIVFGFVALAVGGFGSFRGCLVGGVIVGLAEAVTQRYLGSGYPTIVVFALLIAVLMFRPTGLFGRRSLRAL